jgi:dUTP pyrophosphatase
MIKIKKLPNYQGGKISNIFQLRAAIYEPVTLSSVFGGIGFSVPRLLVPVGIEIFIEGSFGVEISGRSGLASKHGIILLNPTTLTKENYGEVKLVLCNLGGGEFTIHPGDIVGEVKIVKLAEEKDVEVV